MDQNFRVHLERLSLFSISFLWSSVLCLSLFPCVCIRLLLDRFSLLLIPIFCSVCMLVSRTTFRRDAT